MVEFGFKELVEIRRGLLSGIDVSQYTQDCDLRAEKMYWKRMELEKNIRDTIEKRKGG